MKNLLRSSERAVWQECKKPIVFANFEARNVPGKSSDVERSPVANESVRYRVLKNAKGKCELCGMSSSLRPIDIDHIVPQTKSDKDGNVIDVHNEANTRCRS